MDTFHTWYVDGCRRNMNHIAFVRGLFGRDQQLPEVTKIKILEIARKHHISM